MIRDEIKKIIKDIVKKDADLEHPNNPKYGDYYTNITLKEKLDAKKLAKKLEKNNIFKKVKIAGPGFINFYISQNFLFSELEKIIKQDNKYGDLDLGKNKKIQVEFISANPTGPLTVANARGGPYGDTLANIFKKAGYKTEKAYYVNDHGNQIEVLGHSVLDDDKAQYKGEYIEKLQKKLKNAKIKNAKKIGYLAAGMILAGIKKTTEKLNINYDEWISENKLYESGKVDKVLDILKKKKLTYKEEGALWFKSKKFGDNRDRVLVKKDGEKTYLAGDIALHNYKFKNKKFDRVINIWGADHHGDIPGLMAGVEAIGYKNKLKIILLQFVTIIQKKQKQKMSKRAGNYITMDELLDEVGSDAIRFLSLQKSPDTHLTFDIDLAKEQSSKNPVYYVQYAYARICSVLKKAPSINDTAISKLSQPSELNLIRQLIKFPEIIEDTALDYQVQRLPYYALDLSHNFHKFYEKCRVIDKDNKDLTQARLRLVKATQIVLKNTLNLMGIGTPKKM